MPSTPTEHSLMEEMIRLVMIQMVDRFGDEVYYIMRRDSSRGQVEIGSNNININNDVRSGTQ